METTTCTYGGALHWHNHGSGPVGLYPLDSDDPNGTSFAFSTSTCTTVASSTAIATSSDIAIMPTMTAGEIANAALLVVIILAIVVHFLGAALSQIPVWFKRSEKNK